MGPRNALGVLVISMALVSQTARAHWCHDFWSSAYNIVVKPAQDTVTVPSTGSATLDVYVQNNMGYPLYNFGLAATASGYSVSVSHQAPKKKESASVYFLLPGEKLKYTLTISRSSGAASLNVENLTFNISFGSNNQDVEYGGANGKEVVIRKTDTSLSPARPLTATGNSQAAHLHASVAADFGDLDGGIGALMQEFCVGRASWKNTDSSYNVTTSLCPGTVVSATCGTAPSVGNGYKYDYQHLWAAGELAYRKAAANFPADVFRSQLICALNGESKPAFQFFPYAILGYLGESATVRTFLQGKISSGSADEKAAAKTALLLFESPSASGYAQLHSDVIAALTSSNEYVQMLAATSLGIRDQDDAAVQKLIDGSNWIEPDTSDNGLAMFAAHLLNIVAWDRRGWAIDAADAREVSFYSTTPVSPDKTPPKAPTGVSCATQTDGGVRLSWAAVTQDVDGGTESLKGYVTSYGTTTRGTATSPSAFSYDHQYPTSGAAPLTGTSSVFSGLSGTQPTYFSVVAQDNSSNTSAFSQEVHCTPTFPPVAVLSCTPDSGVAPLSVTCTSASSTDPNGASDITSRVWQVNGQARDGGVSFSTSFSSPSSNSVRITLTDGAGLMSSASSTIQVMSPDAGNNPPTAVASASPLTTQTGVTVTFNAEGSSDPEDQPLTYRWSFGDGSTSTTKAPTHSYSTPGTYDVVLTVSDNGVPPLEGTAVVTVLVTGNLAPDVSGATATPLAGDAPLRVIFSADGVTDPEGNPMHFSWSFGDGTPDVMISVATHDYTQAGVYTARLSVTDDGTPALVSPATQDFAITVHTEGVANRPPDCSEATVTPTAGSAPLTVVLDATTCVDPDGDMITVTWSAPGPNFTVESYTDAKTTITLTTPGATAIKLTARDSAADALETERSFTVNVGTQGGGVLGGCSTAFGPAMLPGLALIVLVLRRRRIHPAATTQREGGPMGDGGEGSPRM